MEGLVSGEIVALEFPYSNFLKFKRRPALVVSTKGENRDIILCQITSKYRKSNFLVNLGQTDLDTGKLKTFSYIKFNFLINVNESVIKYKMGKVNSKKLLEINRKIISLFS